MVKFKNKKVAIVTGSAGFIGFHISKLLLESDWKVIGVDCLSDYYDISLKKQISTDPATGFFAWGLYGVVA